MNYLVMETRLAYAVLLDEKGSFIKAANFNYEVGQIVTDVVPLRDASDIKEPSKLRSWFESFKKSTPIKTVGVLAGSMAILGLAYFGYYQPNFIAYGTVDIQINPHVQMTLSRNQNVLDLQGMNSDGDALVEGFDFKNKKSEEVSEQLVQRAIDMGYLSDQMTISISMDGGDVEWIKTSETKISDKLNETYGNQIIIELSIEEPKDDPIIIPVEPSDRSDYDDQSDYQGTNNDDSDYDDVDNDSDYGNVDYDDSDYDTPNSDVSDVDSDYDDSDFDDNSDFDSDYDNNN